MLQFSLLLMMFVCIIFNCNILLELGGLFYIRLPHDSWKRYRVHLLLRIKRFCLPMLLLAISLSNHIIVAFYVRKTVIMVLLSRMLTVVD